MGDTSVSVSKDKEPATESGFKHNIEGDLANAMEEKIKWCVEAGAKNKISYEMKAGNAADQVVKACEDTHGSRDNFTSRFLAKFCISDPRKIRSKINTPVLLIQ